MRGKNDWISRNKGKASNYYDESTLTSCVNVNTTGADKPLAVVVKLFLEEYSSK